MKATRKLIPAIAMLLVSAVVLSTASYAWFTMSKNVKATDMELTVTAPTNLLISSTYSTTLADYDTSKAATAITDTTKKLYPASSLEGTNFFATVTNTGDGYPTDKTTFEKVSNDAANDKYYYRDYVVYLTTTGDKDVSVALQTLAADGTFTTIDGANAASKCVSMAVVYQGVTTSALTETPTTLNVATKNVVRAADCWSDANTADSDNATDVTGVVGAITTATDYKGTADAANLADGTTGIITVAGNTDNGNTVTSVTAVVIRMWFEGQSDYCYHAIAGQDVAVTAGFAAVQG